MTYPYSMPSITPLRTSHVEAIRWPHDLVLRRGIQHPSCCGDEHLAVLLVRPFCFDVPDSCRAYNTSPLYTTLLPLLRFLRLQLCNLQSTSPAGHLSIHRL